MIRARDFNKKHFRLFISSMVIVCFWILYSTITTSQNRISSIQKKIQRTIIYKERQLSFLIDNYYKQTLNTNFEKTIEIFNNRKFCEENAYVFYYYEENQLKYWTSNLVPVPEFIDTNKLNNKVWELKNGVYKQQHILIPSKKACIIGLFLVQNNYPYENLYLSNAFHSSFNVPENTKLVITPSDNQIYSENGDYLFSIYKDSQMTENQNSMINVLIALIVFILVFISIDVYLKIKRISRGKKYFIYFLLMMFLILSRVIQFYLKLPETLYNSPLFGPNFYASSLYLPSLGDLFLNTICLFIVQLILFFRVKIYRFSDQKNSLIHIIIHKSIAVILLFSSAYLFYLLVSLFNGVVLNSSIPLATENVFKFNLLSYLVFLIFICLLATLFMYVLKAFIIAKHFINNTFHYRIVSVITSIFVGAFSFISFQKIEIAILGIALICTIFYITGGYKSKKKPLILLIFVIYASIFTSSTINIFNALKEEDSRMLVAMKIANEHDPIVEYRLREINQEIPKDKNLLNLLKEVTANEQQIIDYLLKEHLSTFIYRYKILITICSENQNLIIQPDNYEINCSQFFTKKINAFGTFKSADNIWYMNYEPGTVSYLSMVKIPRNNDGSISRNYTIYMELDSKSYISDIGYPELLIDKKRSNINPDISNYSYARYIYDDLVGQYGKFFYSTNLSTYNVEKSEPKFFESNGYRHLIFKANDKETIIIGKRIPSFFERMVPISLFILYYGFIVLLFYLLFSVQPLSLSFAQLNFQAKLQFTMILIILSSFLVICAMTVVYFVSLNLTKNKETVTEKSHAILVQLEQQFHQAKEINNTNLESLNDLIQKLSGQFFTDINLFDRYGNLIASSRPQMFHQGLISNKINAEAFKELRSNKKTIFMHDENIGKQKYLSSYMPFRNNKGITLAYINLPYFAKQEDLNREISSFLIAFLSVYVLLTLIAISITIFFANYITRPLKLMRDKIGQIKLRGKNEKINWNSRDELGALIVEYNRMVDELDKSAELLASSERDYAWREMAQQVAHEIKNPLTPMKLSIQYLQRAWDNKETDWDERLKRFSQTLVEQIDALSAIATSFSDFAKMPKGEFNIEELSETIKSVISLFEDNNQQIQFEVDDSTLYLVNADKNQLIRVLNNLIKNATQAIREEENGKIKISLVEEKGVYLLSISDNGVGISEDLKHKIFSPNFTTKTGGTGLGLAMVKNIVKSMNGEIWFESVEGAGTTFFIRFPKAEDVV